MDDALGKDFHYKDENGDLTLKRKIHTIYKVVLIFLSHRCFGNISKVQHSDFT